MYRRNSRAIRKWSLKSLLSFFLTLGMLLPHGLFNTAQPVAAHNLDASAVYVFFDPDTQAMLDRRIAGQDPCFPSYAPPQPLLKGPGVCEDGTTPYPGDTIGLIIKAVPDNGTTTGVGGYTTFYIPNGVQVIDAAFLTPGDMAADGITGYDKVAAHGQALMPNVGAGGGPTVDLTGISRGPNIAGVTANLVNSANVNNGTLPGVYGDLGIFYSTAPETAYGSYTTAPNASKRLTNNSGDWVGWRTPLQAPLNLWDVWQMAGFGINGTTDASLPATPRVDSNGRGNTIWGNASAVAGPQSGYAWDFNLADYTSCAGSPTAAPTKTCIDAATDQMGPWQRIKYPGSQIAYDIPGDTTLGKFAGGLDASNVGYALSPSNPLPPTISQTDNTSPKAIRFAYGQLTLNTPEFAWVKFKVNDFSAILDPTGCPVWRVDTFGGDAGGDDNGKDHIWRYYDPNSVQLNGCLAVGKPANRDVVKVGDYYQYTLSFYNVGNVNLTNVVVTDQLPAGVTFVSSVPAQTSGPNPLRWVIGSLQKGQSWKAVVTVRASGTGILLNTMTATGTPEGTSTTITSSATERTISGLVPYLRQNKSVAPSSVAPGGTVAYTIQIDNIGTGATGTPIVITEYLPSGFTYEATPAPTARVNGAVVTPSVNATNPNRPVFTIPATLQAGQSLFLTFTAKVAASQTPGSYCNSYTSSTPVNQTTGALACVTVAGGKIGDFIWRDWDGDGMQDAGEEGIANVKVYIDSNNNGVWDTGEPWTTTAANGAYYFPGLTAGTYVVRVDTATLPANHTQSGDPDQPNVTCTTCDNRHSVTLSTNQQYLTADFGYKPTGTASIGDKVFEDIANDGAFTSGTDFGIPNVTVWLYEDSNNNGVIDAGDALVATAVTTSSGDYLFSNLAAGYNYLVKVDKTDADIQSYFNTKYGSGTSYQLSTAEIIPSPNLSGADLDNDFGFWRVNPGSIGDQVFLDNDANGAYNTGDTPLAGVTVWLYRDANNNGIAEPGELAATTTSAANGTYSFGNLGPGNYIVMVDTASNRIPSGYTSTTSVYRKSLAAGENYTAADFPFVPLISKTVDKSYVNPSGTVAERTLTFGVTVNYPLQDYLESVRVIDPLPTGVTYVGGSANAGGTYGPYVSQPGTPGEDTTPSLGMAIYNNNNDTFRYRTWDVDNGFSAELSGAAMGTRIQMMAGASNPTSAERIITFMDGNRHVFAATWDGTTWSAVPVPPANTAPGRMTSAALTTNSNLYWGAAVAYEQSSGHLMLVWNDDANAAAGADDELRYVTRESGVWGTVTSLPTAANQPQNLRIAARPNSDQLALVYSSASGADYIRLWSGTAWSSETTLDTTGGSLTSVNVAYEAQSGRVMVVYGKPTATSVNLFYRIWDGSSWSAEASITPPAGVATQPQWVAMASDPFSNRIAVGVVTSGGRTWLSVWNGSAWVNTIEATSTALVSTAQNVAVAFETLSGDLLAAYGVNSTPTAQVRYRTWTWDPVTQTGAWSAETAGPTATNGNPNVIMLTRSPTTNRIMMALNTSTSRANYVPWDGSDWDTTVTEASANTQVTGQQPMIYLWNRASATDESTALSATATPIAVALGGAITVKVDLKSARTIANVTPSLVTQHGSATCTTADTIPATVSAGVLKTFTYTCTPNSLGEIHFVAAASSAGGYAFPDAESNTVLVSANGASNVVTWNLGSTTPAVPASTATGKYVYAFRGVTTNAFWAFNPATNVWNSPLDPADNTGVNIGAGGALATDGARYIYALQGGGTQGFYRYDASSNTWSALANTGVAINTGGALVYLNGKLYAFAGNNTTTFLIYDVGTNSWSAGAAVPLAVGQGGALATDGRYIYGLRGNRKPQFYRYDPATNTWMALLSAPANIGKGGSLVYANGALYALRGDGQKTFYRYNIAANTWTALAPTLGNIAEGGALTFDGQYLRAFQGKTTTYYRYNLATNVWETRAAAPAATGWGGALAYLESGNITRSQMQAYPTLVTDGPGDQTVKVLLTLTAENTINTITAGTISVAGVNGANATCGSPTLKSADANLTSPTDSVIFEWTCTVTAGTSPGSVRFSANATGASPATTFGTATSNSVLLTPPLTYQAVVNSPATVNVVENIALLNSNEGIDPTASNTTRTATTASIGDRVWADANGNGAQDAGELGLAGVKVYIDSNNNGVWDAGEPYAITDALGNYRIYNLSTGTYTVRTDPATYPTGYLPTTAPVLSVNLTSAGQQYNDADFGLNTGTGQIGDTIWLDVDNNGSQNGSEAGLPGIGVTLERLIGGVWYPVKTTTTGANGKYLFSGLIAGDYRVKVNENSLVTSPYGGSYTLGSAMAPTYDYDGIGAGSWHVAVVNLPSNTSVNNNLDFGYNWAGSIAGRGWYDTNANGVIDTGEAGAPGSSIVLYLVNADGSYTILDIFVTSTGNYDYLFANLPPGNYVVGASEQEVPAPAGSPNAGQVGTMVFTTADHYAVPLSAGQTVTNKNFGFVEAALLEGTLFHDVNSSAFLDTGEPGLSGILITLTGYDSNGNPVNRTTTTDAAGEYRFLVPAGNYTISYSPAAVAAAFPGLTLATTPTSLTVSAAVGHEIAGLNFGVDNSGVIGDRVWNDANGNGAQDAGEVGLPGVTVNLYQGATLLATTVTDASGLYHFTGLADGTYTIKVDSTTVPSGFTQTYDNYGATNDHTGQATISGGNTVNTVDFGYRNPTSYSISGNVFNDLGTIGVKDGADVGLWGITVYLYNTAGTTIVATTVTDSSGNYTFPGIPNGNYLVKVDAGTLPSKAYVETFESDTSINNSISVTISGAPSTGHDFGFHAYPSSISGSVCVGGSNGICDTGEPLVANVAITLIGAGPDGLLGTADDTTANTTTNSSGYYEFTNLVPGLYQVVKTNPANTTSVADRDGGNPDNITVNLATNQNVTGRDFEVYGGADLAVTKSDGLTLVTSPQTGVVYTIIVANNGIIPAANVVLNDTIGAGLTYVSDDCGMTGSGPYVWTIGTLAVGESRTCHVTVNVNSGLSDGTMVTNYANATTTTIEPNITNNEQSDIDTVYTAPAPDLQITKSDGQTQVLAGAALAYTINYKNVGNADAANVVIVDTLPANVDYVSSSPSGTYNSGAHTVTWNLGTVAQGADVNITLNVMVKNTLLPGAVVLNRVNIATSSTDRNPLDNSAVDSDIIVAPFVVLEKSVSGPAYIGAEVTYSIRWENNSSDTANDVVITDIVPDHTTLVAGSITGGGSYDSGTRTITWSLGNKAPGASGTVSFKVIVNSGVTGSAVNQTAPTLSTETSSGSVTITSTTTARTSLPWCATGNCLTYRGIFMDTNPVPPAGWNDNPRATAFDQSSWTQPVASSTAEYFYWMSAGDLNAEWTAVNTSGLTYPNYTYFRQMFCLPLNAVPQNATLKLAGDDISTIYLNGVPLGRHQGAGSYSTFSGNSALQSGINLLAVQLINNTHSGHPSLGGQDHSGLLFNLQASYSSLRPFAYAPAMTLAGQSVTIQVDENALGGRTPYYYRYDWGDGTVTDYTENLTSDSHTYNTPGVYIATVTARAQYGCTGSDQVVITVLPATSKILGNTAHVAYQNTAGKAYSGQSGVGILLSVGTVTGFVYTDVNGDGVYTAGVDTPASGVTVRVVDGYGVAHTGVTGVDGNYTVNEVSAGYATVTLVNPPAGVQTQGTNPTTGILVAAGQTTFEENNGFYAPTAIGNRVWLDENGNGIQDAGEPGIPNITVQLWDSTHTTLIASAVTDADGNYIFKNVPPGTYQVDVLDTSLPTGLVHSTPTFSGDFTNKADPYSVTIAAGQEAMTADFGYNWASTSDVTNNTNTGTIGDRVWIDANGDGRQDPGEVGLSGVTVALWYDANGDGSIDTLYASTTTDATGRYSFDNLPKGIYEVRITAGVTGYTQTGDPDATLDGKTTQPIVLAPGDVFVNADFGYQPGAGMTASIGDTVWFDANANGTKDTSEPGIPGVTVALIGDLNGNGVWDAGEPILASVVTNASGSYQFTGVPVGGNYLVWVNDTAAVLNGLAPSYDSDGIGSPHISAITGLSAGGNDAQDFGYKPFNQTTSTALIGDTIFLDRNSNNTADAGEGLEGVRVWLYDSTETYRLATTVTDENGRYVFAGLPAGTYVVKVDTTTLPNSGSGLTNSVDPDTTSPGNHKATVTLTAGEINLTQDFGYQTTTNPNSVSGTLWVDTDADGYMDAGETTYFAGVTVALYDSNGNVIATTVTDSNGDYTFANLPNGTYTVRVTDEAKYLNGYWHSLGTAGADNHSQSDPLSVTLSGNTNITYADFGYYRAPASLGNWIWEDTNANGIQDAGEPGLAGVKVTLVITWPNSGGTTILTTLTDAGGYYNFGNLLLDENMDGVGSGEPTFTLSVATPAGYVATLVNQGSDPEKDSDNHSGVAATVAQGAFNDTYDFGFVRIRMSGTIAPTPLEITTQPGNTVYFVQRWVTTGNITDRGNITVYGIPAGWTTKVYRTTDSLTPGAYTTLSCPSCTLLATESAGNRSILDNNDAIESGPDTGSDGIADTGNLAPPGGEVLVVLEVQVPANAQGGVFTLRERGSSNSDWVIKKALNPSLPYNDDSVIHAEAFKTIVIPAATVGDRVWFDVDGDGMQDVGEPGLANVTVKLYNPGADGQPGGGDDVLIATTTTDANGNYLFDGVTAGNYYVMVDATTLPAGLTASTGTTNPSATFTVVAGNAYLDKDFGYKNASTTAAIIGDFVWSDYDQDGVQDPGEPGIAGITVKLKDNHGTVIATTTTGPDGRYLFTNVSAGTYIVEITVPSGYTLTAGPHASINPTMPFLVNGGNAYLNVDFGLYTALTYTITDRVWYDANVNGTYNPTAGEIGLVGVGVNLLDSSGKVIATTTSGADGLFTFSGVPNGNYTIRIADTAGVLSGLSSTTAAAYAGQQAVTVAGANVTGEHFGYVRLGSIGRRVWQDTDGNGLQDAGEPGLVGVTVDLYTDPNGDGDPADGTHVGTQTTAADGSYLFTGLADGNYVVVVTPPLGYTQTGDPNQSGPCVGTACDHQTPVTLAGGLSFLGANFGYRNSALPDISGTVWNDANRDGNLNAGERRIAGVTIALFNHVGQRIATAVTLADGSYTFYDVPAGTYSVKVTDQNHMLIGYQLTSGTDSYSITVENSNIANLNFGYAREAPTAIPLLAFSATSQSSFWKQISHATSGVLVLSLLLVVAAAFVVRRKRRR